jgi:hypothetical protein
VIAVVSFRLCWPPYGALQSEISGAFAESASSGSSGRYEWECRWGCENESWIRSLPPLSRVTCYDRLFPHGACCGALFDGGSYRLYSEIHVFRVASGRYKISFYSYPDVRDSWIRPLRPAGPALPLRRQVANLIRAWSRRSERYRSGSSPS